jgi:hypothetical protein
MQGMQGHLLGATMKGINLAESSPQPLFGILDALPGARIGRRVERLIMAGAGHDKRTLIWEVAVDRQPFDACQLRDGTDGGFGSSDRLMEADRCLDNALSRLLLMFRTLL